MGSCVRDREEKGRGEGGSEPRVGVGKEDRLGDQKEGRRFRSQHRRGGDREGGRGG